MCTKRKVSCVVGGDNAGSTALPMVLYQFFYRIHTMLV
jgi:hypothetical protein